MLFSNINEKLGGNQTLFYVSGKMSTFGQMSVATFGNYIMWLQNSEKVCETFSIVCRHIFMLVTIR